jgi:hypothetical protein
MISLLFVGEGPRDDVVLPPLVEGLLKTKIDAAFSMWPRLSDRQGGMIPKGFARKLVFALRTARDRGLQGLVAVVDQDREPPGRRLKQLKSGRDADRQQLPPLPTALGEARPHIEAWLLDDPDAVRTGLSLPPAETVPNVRKTKNPKAEIERLRHLSLTDHPNSRGALRAIAVNVALDRSAHASETGFEQFAAEVRQELNPLVGPSDQ